MQPVAEYYKYCPEQVEVKISDAVCIGRRRSNFSMCPGCQFNDDEKEGSTAHGVAGSHRPTEDPTMIEQLFKAYDVRAVYPDPLDETGAWRIGYSAAQFLLRSLGAMDRVKEERTRIVVGRDMRKSSPALSAALIEGIRSAAASVIDVGMIDTPQLYFAVNQVGAIGGIQTTASHNPAQYNGFKICGPRGTPIGVNTGLGDICRIAQKVSKHKSDKQGLLTKSNLTTEYKTFIRRFLEPVAPTKIVIDSSNGMAGKWAPVIFDDVPNLSITHLNAETTGEFVHDPNPLVDANLDQLREEVRRTGADFGVCFDGDADRCMLVDERAEIVRCDKLTALLAKWFLKRHPGATIVYDLRSSRVVADEIKAAGGVPRRERVGHAFMKKSLIDTGAVFGGELSGHFYFKDAFNCDSGMLALVTVLNVLSESGRPLSELIAPLNRYSASGERNFESSDKDGAIAKLADVYADAKVDYLDGITVQYDSWWFNVRKSNTEPLLRLNLEAETPELLASKLDEVAAQLGTPVAH